MSREAGSRGHGSTYNLRTFGGVAQLGRALRSQRRGHGFKSRHLHQAPQRYLFARASSGQVSGAERAPGDRPSPLAGPRLRQATVRPQALRDLRSRLTSLAVAAATLRTSASMRRIALGSVCSTWAAASASGPPRASLPIPAEVPPKKWVAAGRLIHAVRRTHKISRPMITPGSPSLKKRIAGGHRHGLVNLPQGAPAIKIGQIGSQIG